ncbi:ABC transporter permease [Rhodococcoides corynebacterioides]|uniref:ABC transporter permease n=1 Tax=Rhodococcoides corynebacterioides TaxID=53972 RepID=A0ABS7NZW5_9NOCA|nr:ABC transporter permease [Rhodococcus corynebacterioides]MBY6365689.1 ABC transporter permease [Rhodococcus corynebacterioides]MBY6406420.1 ABC transporter permease [Rhodococcus corynebacterioides]
MRWLIENVDTVLDLTRTHLYLSLLPLLIGLVIAVPVGSIVRGSRWARRSTLVVASIAFTIPSLALFVTVPLIAGLRILDPLNVVIALTVYSTALLIRAVPEALDSVPPEVVDAATAMGFGRLRRTVAVELPLALPVLTAGVRVVAVTNISLVSVGSVIGIGGLGQLFTQGYQRNFPDQILAGIIAIVVLALFFDAALYLVGRALTPWTRTGRRRRGSRVTTDRAAVGEPT